MWWRTIPGPFSDQKFKVIKFIFIIYQIEDNQNIETKLQTTYFYLIWSFCFFVKEKEVWN